MLVEDIKLSESLESLQRQVRRYRSLVLAIAENVWVADPDGQRTEVVHGESVTSVEPGWVAVSDRLNAMHPDDRISLERKIVKSLATFEIFRHEARILDDSHKGKQISLLAVPVRNETGEVEEWIGLTEDITLLKEQSSRIADELEWRRVSFEQSLDPIVVLESDGSVFACNASFCRVLGYSRDELKRMFAWDWDLVYDKEYLLERLAGNKAPDTKFETRHRCKNGQTIDLEVGVFPFELQGKRLIYCLHRDISQRKEHERKILRQTELQKIVAYTASHLVESGPDEQLIIKALNDFRGKFGIDGHLNYDFNESTSTLDLVSSDGFSEESLRNLAKCPITKVPEQHDLIREKMCYSVQEFGLCPAEVAIQQHVVGSCCIPLVDGGKLIGVLTLISFTQRQFDSDVLGALFTLASLLASTKQRIRSDTALRENQTKVAAAVAALRDSDERFRQLAEHIVDVFWIYDVVAQKYLYVSPAFNLLFSVSAEEFSGTTAEYLSFLHEDDRPAFLAARHRQLNGHETVEEYRILSSDGKQRWIIDRATPIMNSVGFVYRLVGVLRDVTERVAAQDKLAVQQSELLHVSRLNTLGLMSAAISHELNQPLSAIANFAKACEFSLDEATNDTRALCAEYLRQINSQSLRAGEILRRLLDFGKRSPARMAAIDINQVLQDSVALAGVDLRNRGIRVEWQLQSGLRAIEGDRIQLQQVFVNLFANAADAMDDVAQGRKLILLRSFGQPGKIVVEMEDQGCGITNELREKLFIPFNSTKQRGSGIGLSICKTIVDAHRGEITAREAQEHGTIFSVVLPAGGTQL